MAFESFLPFAHELMLSLHAEQTPDTPTPVTLENRPGYAYSEQAFRHFLVLERERAALAGRRCLLLLVSLRPEIGDSNRMSRALVSSVFAGLQESVREVDFVGWYRDGQVAAAVLTQGLESPGASLTREIGDRVSRALARHVPRSFAARLRVRVLALGNRSK